VLRRIDPHLAADAMAAHQVTVDDGCWLVQTDHGLKGCAVGALFFAEYEDVPLVQQDVVEWAVEHTGSRLYVLGFDAGFHGFAPMESPPPHYTLGLADGKVTRLLVEESSACRPALWCWRAREDT